jgi:hypothetical protein
LAEPEEAERGGRSWPAILLSLRPSVSRFLWVGLCTINGFARAKKKTPARATDNEDKEWRKEKR